MSRKTAIVFDLDGTLLDTLDDIAAAMNRVLAARGFATHPVARYKQLVGDGMEMLVRRALPAEVADEALIAEAMAAMRADYGAHWNVETRPYEGVPALLDALVARGLQLFVLSNKPEETTKLAVAELLASWSFLAVWGARKGMPKKPDPAALETLIAEHGLSREALLYVGDTNTDMRTAQAAQVFAVGVTWGFRDEAELRASGADHIIHRPEALLDLL